MFVYKRNVKSCLIGCLHVGEEICSIIWDKIFLKCLSEIRTQKIFQNYTASYLIEINVVILFTFTEYHPRFGVASVHTCSWLANVTWYALQWSSMKSLRTLHSSHYNKVFLGGGSKSSPVLFIPVFWNPDKTQFWYIKKQFLLVPKSLL